MFFILLISNPDIALLIGVRILLVRMIGVEPTCLTAPDPKSGASANFATSAKGLQK